MCILPFPGTVLLWKDYKDSIVEPRLQVRGSFTHVSLISQARSKQLSLSEAALSTLTAHLVSKAVQPVHSLSLYNPKARDPDIPSNR